MKDRVKEALDIVRRAKALGDYDSNVIGMAAEIIAEEEHEMTKAPVGTRDIDGCLPNDKTIQVKGWSCSRVLTYRGGTFFRIPPVGGADMLMVILIYSRLAEYEVLYFGKSDDVGEIGSLRGKQERRVSLRNLRDEGEINCILEKCQREQ